MDLTVDPTKEKEMLHNFETIFRPAASKQPGYIGVKMCKLPSTIVGKAPAGSNYRFVLTFASEELRQKWVATDTHPKGLADDREHSNRLGVPPALPRRQ